MDTLDQGFQERVMHLAGRELPLKLPALTQSFLDEVMTTSALYWRKKRVTPLAWCNTPHHQRSLADQNVHAAYHAQQDNHM